MLIRLLGPVELRTADGRLTPPGGPKRSGVLALLALELGRVVPVARLSELLWGDAAPAQSRAALQGHIAALRKLLTGTPFTLLTRTPGYRLDGPADQIDALRFDHLTARATTPTNDADAVALLDEALALWHGGSALADLPDTELRRVLTDRLARDRTRALERWAGHLLRLDRAPEAVSALDRAAAADPLYEPLAALLVRCLHRSGRPADALAAYHRTRHRLSEELGVRPGRALRAAVDEVLSPEPAPLPTPAPSPAPIRLSGATVRPAVAAPRPHRSGASATRPSAPPRPAPPASTAPPTDARRPPAPGRPRATRPTPPAVPPLLPRPARPARAVAPPPPPPGPRTPVPRTPRSPGPSRPRPEPRRARPERRPPPPATIRSTPGSPLPRPCAPACQSSPGPLPPSPAPTAFPVSRRLPSSPSREPERPSPRPAFTVPPDAPSPDVSLPAANLRRAEKRPATGGGGQQWSDRLSVTCTSGRTDDSTQYAPPAGGGRRHRVRPVRRPPGGAAAGPPDRAARHPGRRRVGEPGVRAVAAALGGGPAHRHQPVHQQPGRFGHGGAGDLRHDAADPERRVDAGDGVRGQHGAVPADGGRAGQAVRAAERADHDAPAVGGHRRHRVRHRDPGGEPGVHQARDRADHRRAHRPERGDDRPGRRPGPLVHRRTGPRVRDGGPGAGVARRGRLGVVPSTGGAVTWPPTRFPT
ncbi:putative transcriptional regulator [Kitasatospora setae KM-6054]|uniref:Putative transcriptional regulator n=1 Tax=Kitasatospora setae (strain ATCC 33774 / DSM 43861 / JCM 3304 / KCC A-0304 / NBRC 14216 / KM-6054) TaxID=452652 RepID=E4N3I2_KITSK|nr:putative transcriptional regulator [Kitasatospora setae KM-6054]